MTEQLSPDGFYRWNGTEWVPTGKVPEVVTAGVRPAAAPGVAAQPAFCSAHVTPVETRIEGYGPSHHSPHGADVPTAKKKMAIQAFELKKHFGKQKVLDGVTMGIPES